MSGSETPQSTTPNMRLSFSADGTAVYRPVTSTSNIAPPTFQPASAPASATATASAAAVGEGSAGRPTVPTPIIMGSGVEPLKRKRGRPRKYGPDGTMSLAIVPVSQTGGGGFSPSPPLPLPVPPAPAATATVTQNAGSVAGTSAGATVAPNVSAGATVTPNVSVGASSMLPSGGSVSAPSMKKVRGRPAGSSNRKHQLDALGPIGVGFMPHIITVKAGEDISSKIMSFSQQGPRAICILSANGAISNVTLRQAATSGVVTYEGRFEILSLSGSFLLTENGSQRSRTGGLSVSLSGPDGRVLGGGVAGLLIAASPVQVVAASFIADSYKEKKSTNQIEPLSATARLAPTGGPTGVSSPPSHGTVGETSGVPGSPLNQGTGACNNSHPQAILSIPWN